jgi:hypothetical protein
VLHRVGHYRPHVAQAGQAANGIRDGTRGRGVAQRPEFPDPPRHPGRPAQPDKGRVMALPGGRDQDVDEFGLADANVVEAKRRRTRDHAAAARIQQGGHLLLQYRRRPGRGDIDARQQTAPRPPVTKAMPQCIGRQANRYRLLACDHVKLPLEDPFEGVAIRSCRWGHIHMMTTGSDKTVRARADPDCSCRP